MHIAVSSRSRPGPPDLVHLEVTWLTGSRICLNIFDTPTRAIREFSTQWKDPEAGAHIGKRTQAFAKLDQAFAFFTPDNRVDSSLV
jgi:hypothetical protein